MAKAKFIAAALLMSSLGVSAAQAKEEYNPVDKLSNVNAYDYSDVGIAPQEMDAPFVRDGIVRDPAGFRAVTAGLTEEQIETMLGTPLTKAGGEWNYNFKFLLPQSSNYMVCQYKVRFDGEQKVEGDIWRRRQCQALVNGTLGK